MTNSSVYYANVYALKLTLKFAANKKAVEAHKNQFLILNRHSFFQ